MYDNIIMYARMNSLTLNSLTRLGWYTTVQLATPVVLAGMLNQPPMYIIHPGPDHSHADYICTMVARM